MLQTQRQVLTAIYKHPIETGSGVMCGPGYRDGLVVIPSKVTDRAGRPHPIRVFCDVVVLVRELDRLRCFAKCPSLRDLHWKSKTHRPETVLN